MTSTKGLTQESSPDQEQDAPRKTLRDTTSPRHAIRWLLVRPETGGLLSAIVALVVFAVFAPGSGFLSVAGTASWLNVTAELGIIAVPVGLLMIAGEFDLSVGSVVGATSMTMGLVSGHYGQSLWVGVLASLAMGVIVGLVNGIIVVKTGLPSFIVTLATLLMLYGGALGAGQAVAQSSSITLLSTGSANSAFNSQWHGFAVSILWWLAAILIATYTLTRTRFGNWTYATGGNLNVARSAGIPTATVKISLFVCSSLGATITGVIETVSNQTGSPTTGSAYDLTAVAAVVIGGVLLTGGYGSAIGTGLGSITYGIVSIGVFYLGWSSDLADLFIGGFLLIAVLANNYVRRVIAGRK